jgi:hypothetical protein
MRLALSLSLAILMPVLTAALAVAGDVHAPPKGSPLRANLLDAARPTFEQEVGAPVEFVVNTLNAMPGWAYGDVKLQRPGGVPIDWSRTKFADDYNQGMLETGHNMFLLQQVGDGWTVVDCVVGPTDVAWDWWRQQRNLPYELFGASPEDFGDAPPSARPRSGG